ncbi:hypothetical protein P154DRAFT_319777 [Amniculicola lignicola CBS 123094]|uniref:Uncharacterized protein n=1 Tax=Amniculicola lignicola CBS 123094 TaxID=1392246 RepID=A0A6A5W5R7_9PLEO|nr:hypothetical protein P154DRAFT_319777 [Amniculicola lignicola CBS 123094]
MSDSHFSVASRSLSFHSFRNDYPVYPPETHTKPFESAKRCLNNPPISVSERMSSISDDIMCPPSYPPRDPALLQARAQALQRRTNTLTATLGHLSSVLEPARTRSHTDLTAMQLHDAYTEWQECMRTLKAMCQEARQVGALIDEVWSQKRREEQRKERGMLEF